MSPEKVWSTTRQTMPPDHRVPPASITSSLNSSTCISHDKIKTVETASYVAGIYGLLLEKKKNKRQVPQDANHENLIPSHQRKVHNLGEREFIGSQTLPFPTSSPFHPLHATCLDSLKGKGGVKYSFTVSRKEESKTSHHSNETRAVTGTRETETPREPRLGPTARPPQAASIHRDRGLFLGRKNNYKEK